MDRPHAVVGVGVAVRKGAWTKEEDILLTKCIQKFGEGRWHLVPTRAGLNRCRKSCRLRWLNYLNPNVKRGWFTKDEVDLIVRMHKLLGNRWSLIAGRIPGRTANDIKNLWNTHIHKNSSAPVANETHQTDKPTITQCNIVRPEPRNFSRRLQPVPLEVTTSKTNQLADDKNDDRPSNLTENKKLLDDDQLVPDEVEECMRWWGNLIDTSENDNGTTPVPFSFPEDKAHQLMILSPGSGEGGLSGYEDVDVDAMWELVNMGNYQ